ncbi:aldehyde dehydrogenase family 3 member B1-like [Neolamprologus brichardi]|uniref:aldehyde dehydrogenase family 3 member B1-like n=1 Tax=Neolamprologus brichardi TaxID=32507 RepID=UPI001643E666|nr:aldehyde dehydrogenase family 3 member B1-like [Neolamprologus brichardi]
MESQSQVLERLRTAFESGVTIPEKFRRTQLTNLMTMIKDNEEQIVNALHKDLTKPKFEAILSEVEIVMNELHCALGNLTSWMQPEYVSKNLSFSCREKFLAPPREISGSAKGNSPLQNDENECSNFTLNATKLDECFVRKEPLGVVLIIGPWNYPMQLLIVPLIGAIAAGNCAVIKPSEVSAATDNLIMELIPKYLSKDCYAVVSGGAKETQALLTNRFDHIFYTGSQAVARVVLQAAAVHLTPVTLELGGKCPCLIYGRVNATAAAHRLVWSKFFNAGQSCVAPDYVLCSKATCDALVPALRQVLEDFYGSDIQKSPDMSRIVTPKHWTRLMGLLNRTKGKVVVGGEHDEKDRYIALTRWGVDK